MGLRRPGGNGRFLLGVDLADTREGGAGAFQIEVLSFEGRRFNVV